MRIRLSDWWTKARDSLWFIPALMTALAALLALVFTRMDIALLSDGRASWSWVFDGGAEGARGVLSTIAGGLITVIGVVFSVTIVALQLASSQFSPRVLRNFTSDRANQLVLGVFIGTLTYSLLVLRVVRSQNEGVQAFVPSLSITLALVLALVSIGFLIFYINHIAHSIQARSMMDRSARDTRIWLKDMFPKGIGNEADNPMTAGAALSGDVGHVVRASGGGYLQSIDVNSIFQLGKTGRYTIRMEADVGQFVLPGASIAGIWPRDSVSDDVVETVRDAFMLDAIGPPERGIYFGITQLADIATKAMSPGINDPTTALGAIDHLAEIIVRVANQEAASPYRIGEDGNVLLITPQLDLAGLVSLAFGTIRHFGASTPAVTIHLLRTLGEVSRLVPEGWTVPVEAEARRVIADARRLIENPADLDDAERAAAWLHIPGDHLRLAA